MSCPTVYQLCKPRPEILAGELPDSIFAADLWDVISKRAHADYQDPATFFKNTHPTENLKILVRDVVERLAGIEGGNSVFRLETGFGGGKTHSLIATVHAALHGKSIEQHLTDYNINHLPQEGDVRIAAFVGEESDPLSGISNVVGNETITTFTPWGQLALMAGGVEGYEKIKENDIEGIAPRRGAFEEALGEAPVLILIDELVLYMARCFALPVEHNRQKINSQWPTFFQTLFSIASRRSKTTVIVTLPSEQDANRKLTGELKQFIPTVLESIDEVEQTAGRHAKSLTPTQSYERASVLGRRLFESVDTSRSGEVAREFVSYYEKQKQAGNQVDSKAFEADYEEQIRISYPFHPEFIRLFAERLADIPEFQATRGALRLVGKTIRAVWNARADLPDAYLLQPYHVDLSLGELRDEVLSRLGRNAFERGLEADVIKPEGGTHANEVDASWPWKAATEASLVVFLHSLPDGSRGLTPSEAALATGRPGCDLGYVLRGLEETERKAWYMRRDGDHFLFRTRASVNKRFQERLTQVQPGEVREALDTWILEIYSGFNAFQVIPFPQDHTAIGDTADRVRLVIVHYDKECGAVGGGHRLNFAKSLFTTTGVNNSPRRYRNNLLFLLAETTRIAGLKDSVRGLIAWERVRKDIETEQSNLAQSSGGDYRTLKDLARRGATGVPAEFMALESDLGEVLEKLGTQELNVRTRLVEAYRVLAFPKGGNDGHLDLFSATSDGPMLECYRVDLGETPQAGSRGRKNLRQAVPEGPILQCLRENNKLVPEPREGSPLVLAPEVIRRRPLWRESEKKISTEDVWDRLRREPELPMLLRQTDLLPSFRAGLTKEPDALWVYYVQPEKKLFGRENVGDLSPVISSVHYLYDVNAAIEDRIVPITQMSPQDVWDHLWPKDGMEHQQTVTALKLLEAAKESVHYPVLPSRTVVWNALQEGARENRWVLYVRGPNLAIGAQEMQEWPGSPRFDESTEFWAYQAALDQGIYPRSTSTEVEEQPLTPDSLKANCWTRGADSTPTEDIERFARNTWQGLSRPKLEMVLQDGLRQGSWCVWKKGADETFYTKDDAPLPSVRVGADWVLVDPQSQLARDNDFLRPGKGPQPVIHVGTPREVMVKIWDDLVAFRNVQLSDLIMTANDRDTLDNTLLATWADKPSAAHTHVTLQAMGQRETDGKMENVSLNFEGRFEQVRNFLSPIWPFKQQGDLDVTITLALRFNPPVPLDNEDLETYRTALMNANQGAIEAKAVPAKGRNQ